jgi:COP9 signalosome complex subunit 3
MQMQDNNLGLAHQALDRIPCWLIKNLTNTYLSLGLTDIAKAVELDEERAREIVVSMVRRPGPITSQSLTYSSFRLFVHPCTAAAAVDVDAGSDIMQIEQDQITASISATGTVTFSDPPVRVSKAEVDRILREAQQQGLLLTQLDRALAGSREYLIKVGSRPFIALCLCYPRRADVLMRCLIAV